jgi:hypothetical protein
MFFLNIGFEGFGEVRRLQPGSRVALICGSGCRTKLTSHFALTPLNREPATEMLLHGARISQRGLIDVDKIGMTTQNSNSDVWVAHVCKNVLPQYEQEAPTIHQYSFQLESIY